MDLDDDGISDIRGRWSKLMKNMVFFYLVIIIIIISFVWPIIPEGIDLAAVEAGADVA